MEKQSKITVPTLEQLRDLPTEALWLEVAQLAEVSVPPVARDADALLKDRSVTPTAEVVFSLWARHQELSASATNQMTW